MCRLGFKTFSGHGFMADDKTVKNKMIMRLDARYEFLLIAKQISTMKYVRVNPINK